LNRLSQHFLKLTSFVWYSAIALVLIAGWSVRDQHYLVAESGIGYWLGIIGGSMMLLLLMYPMRKRFRRWSAIGSVKSWFRIHMILGVAGPLIIVLHSGYELGSFNSSVAFFCMLLVAASGLLGRKLYERIHHGLYGRKIRFEELYSGNDLPGMLLGGSGAIDFEIADEFEEIEEGLTNRHTGVNRSLGYYLKMKSRINRLRRGVAGSDFSKEDKKQILARLKDLRAICVLGVNEILFSYWHVLHLPLFIMLILTGLVHVVVVHFY
jgi:hypothetical protein